jgi:hypothetical protein
MSPAERKAWVERGFKDPKKAYLGHIANAKERGIDFKMTFAEWWQLWEPHYEKRGRHSGGLVMCRTRDEGCYEVGNVRIDTVRANAEERGAMYREALLQEGRLPVKERCTSRAAASWVNERGAWGLDYYSLRKLSEEDAEAFAEIVDNF